jgi:cytochrome c oxidase subunit 2
VIVALAMGGLLSGLLAGLAVQPWRLLQGDRSPPETLMVEMRGRNYLWWFRYPGPDGKLDTPDDVEAGNELHAPVGARVDLLLRSDDYVYALTVPGLERSQVVVPGRTGTMTIQTSAPGSYEVLADPLCGVRLYHDEHMGRILVQPPREFLAWWEQVQ